MKCEICGKGPRNEGGGVSLFRTGEKGPGKDPHWRCESHIGFDGTKMDAELIQLVAVLEEPGSTKQ